MSTAVLLPPVKRIQNPHRNPAGGACAGILP